MKLVINVPEKLTCEGFERPFTEEEKNILIKAIGNATPLDNIRDEIAEEHNDCMVTEHYDEAYGLELALGIIGKYRTESEDAE